MPNEQPEPKPYPIKGEPGFCPLGSLFESGPAATFIKKLPPCDPFNCALGIKETKECCIKDAARSWHSLYMWNCDRTAGETQLRQLIKELSDRLGAILQSMAAAHQGIPFLAKQIREAVLVEGLTPIERQLGRITAQLERIAPPPSPGNPV